MFFLSELLFGCVRSGLCSHQPLLRNENFRSAALAKRGVWKRGFVACRVVRTGPVMRVLLCEGLCRVFCWREGGGLRLMASAVGMGVG
jgi:hypothetical protein